MFFVLALALFSPTLSPWRLNYTRLNSFFEGLPIDFDVCYRGGCFGKIVELTRTCVFTGWFRSPMIQQGLLYQLHLVWVSAKTLYCASSTASSRGIATVSLFIYSRTFYSLTTPTTTPPPTTSPNTTSPSCVFHHHSTVLPIKWSSHIYWCPCGHLCRLEANGPVGPVRRSSAGNLPYSSCDLSNQKWEFGSGCIRLSKLLGGVEMVFGLCLKYVKDILGKMT